MITSSTPPTRSAASLRAPTTTVAPQALYLMNNPQVRQYARAFAHRMVPTPQTDLKQAIRAGYETTLGREPTAEESADSLAFI